VKAFLFYLLLGIIVLSGWLCAVRYDQLRPHHITVSVAGNRVVSDFWTTNPAYVTWEDGAPPGCVMPFGSVHPVTNYYWSIWPIFQK
jgi:hypothetical protein